MQYSKKNFINFKIPVLITMLSKLCLGLDIESAMVYKFNKDMSTKPKNNLTIPPSLKGSKPIIRKIATKNLEEQPLAKKSPTIILKRKSKLSKFRVTPDINPYDAGGFSYNYLINSINEGETRFDISESTVLKWKKGSINLSHTY